MRIVSLALVLVLTATPVAAQQPEPGPVEVSLEPRFTAFSFYAENDVLLISPARNEDRNYTGGFGFQFSGGFVRDANLDAPLRSIDELTASAGIHRRLKRELHTLLVFGTGFTPDDLNTREPVRDDRPYASLIGISVRRLSVEDETEKETWTSELAVAMLGLPTAEKVQTWLHRRLRANSGEETPYDPLGWHNQISDGGEPTALYRVAYERFLAGDEPDPDTRKHFQLSGGIAASVGYYTNINALASARVGAFNSEYWEFTPNALNAGNQNLGRGDDRAQWDAFLFAAVRPRVNLYNALLQGQFRESVHTVDPKLGTLEWDLGAAVFVPRLRLQVSWNALAGRTSEFKGGKARTHTWGSIVATIAIPTGGREQ
jgi:hypothetical protein